jgi:N-carbamoyl-L-amino-acid hydrolase
MILRLATRMDGSNQAMQLTAPSGPLHDAAEAARAGVPTIMMFVQSLHGISRNKIDDTKEERLALAATAFDKLATKAMKWIN